MFDHLAAAGPHTDLGEEADTYGRLIGSWRGRYRDPATPEEGPMEVHFAWALDGRAVQDVWIAPSPFAEAEASGLKRRMYGSTLRVFDPAARIWRVRWFNPATGAQNGLVGRRVGDDIIQTGYWDDRPQRWRFLEITAERFLWQAHALEDDGETWRLYTEFVLNRI